MGKEWRRVSSARRVKILQPLRRTTRRLASRLPRVKVRRRDTVTSSKSLDSRCLTYDSRLQRTISKVRFQANERLAYVLLQVLESRRVAGVALDRKYYSKPMSVWLTSCYKFWSLAGWLESR